MCYPAKRRWQRYKITAPVIVEVIPADAPKQETVVGSTRDVSAGGIYVVSDNATLEGARVRVHVDLSRVGELINADGKVVRKDEWGFAIEFDIAHYGLNLADEKVH